MADIKKKLGILADQNYVYASILIFFILFLISGMWVFGVFIGLFIVWAVILEFWQGTERHGLKNEIKETLVALALALGIWFGAGFILQTPSPINAVVSCSMLPHVSRGDMVILRGDKIAAPVVEIEGIEGIGTPEIYQNEKYVRTINGSIYSYCVHKRIDSLCNQFIQKPYEFVERHGPIEIGYEKCEIYYPKSGQRQFGPCATYMKINGEVLYENLSNDVVVYQPEKEDYYSQIGDIIHRAFVILKTSDGKEYFLTKGDNNPIFDIQVYDAQTEKGNKPVKIEQFKGKIIFSIPYIGYLKLFISPAAIPTPEGCDRVYAKWLT